MAWVYVIQNSEGRFYIGMTTDLDQRLSDHNDGVSRWTKYRGPWRLIWSEFCDRSLRLANSKTSLSAKAAAVVSIA